MAITKFSNIITYSDMGGEFALVSNSDYEDRFNSMVTDNEYFVLYNMLGASLYNTYVAAPTTEAWTDLLNGKSGYEDLNEDLRNWQGLKYLLVPYHYSKWILSDQYKSSLSGILINNQENSRLLSISQIKKLSNMAFDEFLRRYNECYIYLYINLETYTEFDHYFVNYNTKSKIIKTSIL